MLLLPPPNYRREDHLESWLNWKYESRTEEFLNQLARDVVGNKVFLSTMINEHDYHMTEMIFMVLLFLPPRARRYHEVIGTWLLYEYYEKQYPRSVNGYPTFGSFWSLNRHDSERLFAKINRLQEAMKNALDPTDG